MWCGRRSRRSRSSARPRPFGRRVAFRRASRARHVSPPGWRRDATRDSAAQELHWRKEGREADAVGAWPQASGPERVARGLGVAPRNASSRGPPHRGQRREGRKRLMREHEVARPHGSRKLPRRLGRGTSQGQGKTAGRGTKGQLARTGPGIPGWFEGGQTPLHMRVPKLRGFKNRFRKTFVAVNVGRLADYAAEGKVSPDTLAAKGLTGKDARIKVLGDGVIGTKLEVHAHSVSATARQKIESAGGSIVIIAPGAGAPDGARGPGV